jgi:hypothetical protein
LSIIFHEFDEERTKNRKVAAKSPERQSRLFGGFLIDVWANSLTDLSVLFDISVFLRSV